MQHSEEVEDIAYCQDMTASDLYKQVKSEGLPFHLWYKWIGQKLENKRDEFIRTGEERAQILLNKRKL